CDTGAGQMAFSGSGGGGVGAAGLFLLQAPAASTAPASSGPRKKEMGRPNVWCRPTVAVTSIRGQEVRLETEAAAAVARIRDEHDVRALLHGRLVPDRRVAAVAGADEEPDLFADGRLVIRHRRPAPRIVEPVLRPLRRRTA